MPQELHVIKCFSCDTFQADIIKKVPKWICKMCGEKQSVKKVYGKGSGKECRFLVQTLNEQRFSKTAKSSSHNQPFFDNSISEDSLCSKLKPNKWETFVDDSENFLEKFEEMASHTNNCNIKGRSKWSEFTEKTSGKTDTGVGESESRFKSFASKKHEEKEETIDNIFEDVNNDIFEL